MTRCARLFAAGCLAVTFAAPAAHADLASYLKRPEPLYRWNKISEKHVSGGSITLLHLVSQKWHDIVWEHSVEIFRPDNTTNPEMCGLLNTGGNPDSSQDAIGMQAAKASGCIFAILFDIPNQPLFGGKVEDQIIAYTWLKFLETGDETWPLHFPMAKAVLKSMDAIQAYTKEAHQPPITSFMVTGASKRGWTTWLAGASGDPRIKAIAPMVIDTLNLRKQMPHQLAAYGAPSDSIKAYTVVGMMDKLKSPRGQRLIDLEEPYSYLDKLTMPKLIVLGSNDPYWSQDSLNLYWDDLKGKKWVLYCPNSGHDLANGVTQILATVPAFLHAIATHEHWPAMRWHYSSGREAEEVRIVSDIPIKSAKLWHVAAPTQDFRKFPWSSVPMTASGGGGFEGTLARPETGYAAMFCEATYEIGGKTFTLWSQLRIVPSAHKSTSAKP